MAAEPLRSEKTEDTSSLLARTLSTYKKALSSILQSSKLKKLSEKLRELEAVASIDAFLTYIKTLPEDFWKNKSLRDPSHQLVIDLVRDILTTFKTEYNSQAFGLLQNYKEIIIKELDSKEEALALKQQELADAEEQMREQSMAILDLTRQNETLNHTLQNLTLETSLLRQTLGTSFTEDSDAESTTLHRTVSPAREKLLVEMIDLRKTLNPTKPSDKITLRLLGKLAFRLFYSRREPLVDLIKNDEFALLFEDALSDKCLASSSYSDRARRIDRTSSVADDIAYLETCLHLFSSENKGVSKKCIIPMDIADEAEKDQQRKFVAEFQTLLAETKLKVQVPTETTLTERADGTPSKPERTRRAVPETPKAPPVLHTSFHQRTRSVSAPMAPSTPTRSENTALLTTTPSSTLG